MSKQEEVMEYVKNLTPEQRVILKKNLDLLQDKLEEDHVGILDIMSFSQDINMTWLNEVQDYMKEALENV